MTNVQPSELNYDHYTSGQYDRDIVNSIPYHKELHERIAALVEAKFDPEKRYQILDLGTGTGITAALLKDFLPNATFDVIDFSEQMLAGAKEKLGEENVRYLVGDYSEFSFDQQYDIVVSVIGIHHQNTEGKQTLFRKIHSLIKPGGMFIFGDLVTYADPYNAARNNALHYHHLVEHAADEESLTQWAHHHQFLNDLAPVEDQITWLEESGFTVHREFLQMNTALLFCTKDRR